MAAGKTSRCAKRWRSELRKANIVCMQYLAGGLGTSFGDVAKLQTRWDLSSVKGVGIFFQGGCGVWFGIILLGDVGVLVVEQARKRFCGVGRGLWH